MLPQSEKVLTHAEQQLQAAGTANLEELRGLYKKFLKIENHRIRLRHYSGAGGREICAARASLVDIVLRHLLKAAAEARAKKGGSPMPRLAVVANGGYGRGELNPFSDIDLMFLHHHSL